jgi:hypothetical protein
MDDLALYVESMTHRAETPFLAPDGSLTPEAEAGEALFNSPAVGCADCHIAPYYTDSSLLESPFLKHHVGTTDSSDTDLADGLDTPSLVGVWDTAPYLHDNRALTLVEVLTTFNPSDEHGTTSQLSAQEIGYLVAFLQSIGAPGAASATDAPDLADLGVTTHFDMVFPNPFSSATSLRFGIENNASVARIEIFNVEGRRVRVLLDRRMTRGYHVVGWDTTNDQGRRVAPGLYFARLVVNDQKMGGKKMTVLR